MNSKENLKPIPVSSPLNNPILFNLRCLLDLQLLTIVNFLKLQLSTVSDNILDVGAGNSPYRVYLPGNTKYVGLDIDSSNEFNMTRNEDIVYYSGNSFPFTDNSFKNIMCIEVLEHVYNTSGFLSEIYRCLAPNGKLILTVPWSARRHHLPNDYFRFTPESLKLILENLGFEKINITERGNDFSVIFNKILVVTFNLIFPKRKLHYLLCLPLIILFLPCLLISFFAAHITLPLQIGSNLDPLGYAVTANKSPDNKDQNHV